MGEFVVKASRDPADEIYLIWSTICDAPTWIFDSRRDLSAHLWQEWRMTHPHCMPISGWSPDDRVNRTDLTGTSAVEAEAWYGWEDDAFRVAEGSPPGDAWWHLRRDRLGDYARALLADNSAGAQALLEKDEEDQP